MVTDDEIIEAYRLLASMEGVFVEPASAASLAGLLKVTWAADAPLAGRIVCTLTGHGLKDPDRAVASAGSPIRVEDGLAGLSRLIEQAHVR